MTTRRVAAAVLALVVAVPRTLHAEPEWNTAVAAGVAGRSEGAGIWQSTAFHGALRGDVLWNRRRWGDVGFGPAAELGTVAFSDARLHLGVSALVPVGSLFSVVVTPAAYGRTFDGDAFGASGRVLLGFRSLNYYGSYAMSGGLLLGVDQDLLDAKSRAVLVSVQVDGALLAIPFMLLVSWIRGAPSS